MNGFRDIEQLSAYLDGQLSPSDSARLESRLASLETAGMRLALRGNETLDQARNVQVGANAGGGDAGHEFVRCLPMRVLPVRKSPPWQR